MAADASAFEPPCEPSSVLPLREAARLAGVSQRTVVGWVDRGELPVVWINGRRHVRPADLAATQLAAHVGDIVPAWRADPRHCGWRLRRLREAAGLTQIELAERSGLRHETISMLELAHETPFGSTVVRLARALEVAPTAFIQDPKPGDVDLTLAEAAELLEVPPLRLRSWLVTGQVPGRKAGREWRLARRDVLALRTSGRLRGRSRRLDPRWRG
jgi:transcriptional regulator with XRE-family HTH domain